MTLGIAQRATDLGGRYGAGALGLAGAIVPSIADALGAPRRLLMRTLGLPETGSELVSNVTGLDKEGWGAQGLGMLTEMATDPVTYLGGWLGRMGGRAVGGLAGPGLEAAAMARGPGYAGGVEKLTGAAEQLAAAGGKQRNAESLIERILAHPERDRILGEIPEGSRMFKESNNALAFRTPSGDVLRIGSEPRVNMPEMIQPTRNVRVGDMNIERVPYVNDVGRPEMRTYGDELKRSGAAQGLNVGDAHEYNIGDYRGKPTMLDPGMVRQADMPLGPQIQGRSRTGSIADRLLNFMGGDQMMQDYLHRQAQEAGPQMSDRLRRLAQNPGQIGLAPPQPKPGQASVADRLEKMAGRTPKTPSRPGPVAGPVGSSPSVLSASELESIQNHLRMRNGGRSPTLEEIWHEVNNRQAALDAAMSSTPRSPSPSGPGMFPGAPSMEELVDDPSFHRSPRAPFRLTESEWQKYQADRIRSDELRSRYPPDAHTLQTGGDITRRNPPPPGPTPPEPLPSLSQQHEQYLRQAPRRETLGGGSDLTLRPPPPPTDPLNEMIANRRKIRLQPMDAEEMLRQHIARGGGPFPPDLEEALRRQRGQPITLMDPGLDDITLRDYRG